MRSLDIFMHMLPRFLIGVRASLSVEAEMHMSRFGEVALEIAQNRREGEALSPHLGFFYISLTSNLLTWGVSNYQDHMILNGSSRRISWYTFEDHVWSGNEAVFQSRH